MEEDATITAPTGVCVCESVCARVSPRLCKCSQHSSACDVCARACPAGDGGDADVEVVAPKKKKGKRSRDAPEESEEEEAAAPPPAVETKKKKSKEVKF